VKGSTRDIIAALACIGVGLYWFQTAQRFRELSRLFPEIAGVVLAALAGLLLVITLAGLRKETVASKQSLPSAQPTGTRHYRSATLLGSLGLWTILIPMIGILPASLAGVTLMGFSTFAGHQGTRRAIIIAGVTVILFYALFAGVLRVPFPGVSF